MIDSMVRAVKRMAINMHQLNFLFVSCKIVEAKHPLTGATFSAVTRGVSFNARRNAEKRSVVKYGHIARKPMLFDRRDRQIRGSL